MESMCFDLVVVGQDTGSFFMEFVCFNFVVEHVKESLFMDLLCFDLVVKSKSRGRSL